MTPRLIEGFMKENPHIIVKKISMSLMNQENYTLQTSHESSKTENFNDVIWPGDFAKRGWIAPLNDYLRKNLVNITKVLHTQLMFYAIPLI